MGFSHTWGAMPITGGYVQLHFPTIASLWESEKRLSLARQDFDDLFFRAPTIMYGQGARRPVLPPRHHRNREVRTHEHLTPIEVERLRKAARSVGRHGLRNDTMLLEVTPMTLIQRRFHTDDIALNYMEGPARGQPVVCLHGTVSRWQLWRSVLPALAEQTHVFAFDARGYGTSGRSPQHRYHYRDFVRETAQFLRGAVHAPAVLLGHSRGATVAMAVAVEAPELVKGLCLQEPTLRRRTLSGTPEQHRRMRDLIIAHDMPALAHLLLEVDPRQPRHEALDRAENMTHMDPAAFEACASGAVWDGLDAEQLTRRLRCPTVIVTGDDAQGSVFSDAKLDRLRSLNTRVRVLRVSGARHRAHLSHPAEFVGVCLQFVHSLDVASRP
jgi:pimeloyl-ACP methyl ester carboxylesterase